MKDFLQQIFPRYTDEMYDGNSPVCKGHKHINGGFCDTWSCRWGGGETYNGTLIQADFHINDKVSIHIIGDSLWVVDIRYSGKPDYWEYCINHDGMPSRPCTSENSRHQLERERLDKYLNTPIPNCELWRMVQKKALELLNFELQTSHGRRLGVM